MSVVELENYKFCDEAPDWVELPDSAEYHVGVVQKAGMDDDDSDEPFEERECDREFYKALVQHDETESREQHWKVWEEPDGSDTMPYGPQLHPELVKMMVAYMETHRTT